MHPLARLVHIRPERLFLKGTGADIAHPSCKAWCSGRPLSTVLAWPHRLSCRCFVRKVSHTDAEKWQRGTTRVY
ncbi:hypothetical protein Tb10.70.6110 [Trypanosoma brucei brucei TREU927]|uniref:Uncharacterized protein n=1 Tax=Trypanosoma brucei brucei (strain 927/4 GUTat10.1) TaxID=185431 RepID=Q38C64_TRYB2|nr:hypothetical protein Tb10.70.6110 [Trypanosoma brucei brucei TREU927]EAN77606.1 hypothetical protein Tb10.70.6110 [Trypanosoma brucei brucei TREU927]